jgi:lysozyme family protein
MHFTMHTVLGYINQDDKSTNQKRVIFSVKRYSVYSRHDIPWDYVNMVHYLELSVY